MIMKIRDCNSCIFKGEWDLPPVFVYKGKCKCSLTYLVASDVGITIKWNNRHEIHKDCPLKENPLTIHI